MGFFAHGTDRPDRGVADETANPAQPNEAPDRDLFLDAVAGATPLRDRSRVTTGNMDVVRPPERDASAPRFTVEVDGEHVEGRAHGVSRRQLSALRAGRHRPAERVDLHGCTVEIAHDRLARALDGALRSKSSCLLVVHGRGLHSEGAPVIKEKLIAWLTAGPLSTHVRGFCSATPSDGGPGATYVLLSS